MPRGESLQEYRRKRDFGRTPEPAPGPIGKAAARGRFVIQEHHATALHWDFRLEKDGVLVSWAVPKGLPATPKQNHLAIHTEDHPMEYLTFAGDIPAGEYGGGKVILWDTGTFEAEKFRDSEVMVTLHGGRVRGKYVLFQTHGDQWMVHRMDPPQDPEREELPTGLRPMAWEEAARPPSGDGWLFDLHWGGMRALTTIDGGRATVTGVGGQEIERFPEFAVLGEAMGATQVVFDGEIVVPGTDGKPDTAALQRRAEAASDSRARTLMKRFPMVYSVFDILFLEGHDTRVRPLRERLTLLTETLPEGTWWRRSHGFEGDGKQVLELAKAQGLAGVLARRLDSRYAAGKASKDWLLVAAWRVLSVCETG
jgi:bifunctional non-homologous end joining protein LigD